MSNAPARFDPGGDRRRGTSYDAAGIGQPGYRRPAIRRPVTPARLPAARLPAPPELRTAPGYAPPGYPAAGLRTAGYGPPPGYPRTAAAADVAVLKPGVIPLRPLTLSDIFNGAVAYIRTQPEGDAGPDHRRRGRRPDRRADPADRSAGRHRATRDVAAGRRRRLRRRARGRSPVRPRRRRSPPRWPSIVLSGMLTVVIGRAVFGASITIGEAWQRVRGRLLAADRIHAAGERSASCCSSAWSSAIVVARRPPAPTAPSAFVVGAPLVLVTDRAAWSTSATVLIFAPPLIVLERLRRRSRHHTVVRPGQEGLLAGVRHLAARHDRRVRCVTARCRCRSASAARCCRSTADSSTSADRRTRPGRRSAARSARSSPHRSAPAWWSCSTPTAASGPRRSTWCCRPARRPARRPAGLHRPSVADPAPVTCLR